MDFLLTCPQKSDPIIKLGTQAENMRHKKERNRPIKVGHKLNETEIKEIVESDLTIEKLALDFDVCHTTIIRTKSRNKIDTERKRVGDKPSIPNNKKQSCKKGLLN